MTVDSKQWLKTWDAAVRGRDRAALVALIADDIVMHAPPYWQALEGNAVVGTLLGVLIDTFDDFTYHRQWVDGNDLALEFTARVGKFNLQGVDLITLDDRGKVAQLDVMIRPANALMELMSVVGAKMQERLAEQG